MLANTDLDLDNINTKPIVNNKLLTYQVGLPIRYVCANKCFLPYVGNNTGDPFVGILFQKNLDNTINVLYKGFLLNEPLLIEGTIKEQYLLIYILKQFELYKQYIKDKMPRIKKLKRLNLKLLNRQLVNYLYENIDDIIFGFELAKGSEYAQIMKALIVTTPFYCLNDTGQIKVYKFESNELFDIDIDTEANFLCYFTFEIK